MCIEIDAFVSKVSITQSCCKVSEIPYSSWNASKRKEAYDIYEQLS